MVGPTFRASFSPIVVLLAVTTARAEQPAPEPTPAQFATVLSGMLTEANNRELRARVEAVQQAEAFRAQLADAKAAACHELVKVSAPTKPGASPSIAHPIPTPPSLGSAP